MSTINTETLKLYKNTKLYHGSRYQVYLTNRDMDSYLGTPDYQRTVTYKSIDEPILINESIKNCDEYTYGSITNDGKTYYFFVDYISTDAYKQTIINFTIDWWTTNWSKITCTKAHLTRKPVKPQYMQQPFTPLNTSVSLSELTDKYVIMATYIPSSDDFPESFISHIILEGNEDNLQKVIQGTWYNELGISGSDIKDCFIVPLFELGDFLPGLNVDPYYVINSNTTEDARLFEAFMERYPFFETVDIFSQSTFTNHEYIYNVATRKWYHLEYGRTRWEWIELNYDYTEGLYVAQYYTKKEKMTSTDPDTGQEVTEILTKTVYMEVLTKNYTDPLIKSINVDMNTNDKQVSGVLDWNGNLIWSCPYNINITGFRVILQSGISHIMLQFTPYSLGDLITGSGFVYDCRHPGLFIDSYTDYVLKNRDYDIAMRKIQADREVWTQAGATIEGVGYGIAFGKALGGVSAGLGGVVETGARYLINEVFNPKIQQQYDNLYRRMTDQISLVGDAITNLKVEAPMYKCVLTMDTATQLRMKTDVENNGYVCNEITSNLSGIFTNTNTYNAVDDFTVKPVFQADNVVIEGACNVVGKQQVVSRLINGVEFI